MRLLSALKSDILFQFKQGFYIIYVVITLVYMIALSWIPINQLKIVVPLVIFTDPSVIGLFFVGGIIMLEKNQGIIFAIVVTPLSVLEYIISKVLSLIVVSLFAGVIIAALTYKGPINWLLFAISLILTSTFFTLCGLIIGAKCHTVNQYIVKTIPIMIFFTLPCFSLINYTGIDIFHAIPSVTALKLILASFIGIDFLEGGFLMLYLIGLNLAALYYTKCIFEKHVVFGG